MPKLGMSDTVRVFKPLVMVCTLHTVCLWYDTNCNFTVRILEALSLVVRLQLDNAGAFGCSADKHWRARC